MVITEESVIKNPTIYKIPIRRKINSPVRQTDNNYSIPVDPAGPDCYLGEDKPCELNGIPKFPIANCLVTHDQPTLWRKITSGN